MSNPCGRCGLCKAAGKPEGTLCKETRDGQRATCTFDLSNVPQKHSGFRFTADAFDCALPMTLDSSNSCTFGCLYCFSNNLSRNPDINKQKAEVRQASLRQLENLLSGQQTNQIARQWAGLLARRCPLQWGSLGDPFDGIEAVTGWGLQAIKLMRAAQYPIRVSTKGGEVLCRNEYREALDGAEHFWFTFSLISIDEDKLRAVDVNAPSAKQRLAAMKQLTDGGCHATLRFRPFIPGISDHTRKHPNALRELLEKAREAGAEAVSWEEIFFSRMATPRHHQWYRAICQTAERPEFVAECRAQSFVNQQCMRRSKEAKWETIVQVRAICHGLGMRFSASDPHAKEYNDTDCCCGISAADPTFAGFDRQNMIWPCIQGRQAYLAGAPPFTVTYEDWKPNWGETVRHDQLCNNRSDKSGAVDPKSVRRDLTWNDHQRHNWNNPKSSRGPVLYFDGLFWPTGEVNAQGNLVFEYRDFYAEHGSKQPDSAREAYAKGNKAWAEWRTGIKHPAQKQRP